MYGDIVEERFTSHSHHNRIHLNVWTQSIMLISKQHNFTHQCSRKKHVSDRNCECIDTLLDCNLKPERFFDWKSLQAGCHIGRKFERFYLSRQIVGWRTTQKPNPGNYRHTYMNFRCFTAIYFTCTCIHTPKLMYLNFITSLGRRRIFMKHQLLISIARFPSKEAMEIVSSVDISGSNLQLCIL